MPELEITKTITRTARKTNLSLNDSSMVSSIIAGPPQSLVTLLVDKIATPSLNVLSVKSASENEKSNPSRNTKSRLLVVDDEEDITTVFKWALEENGFEVDTFNDPRDVLSDFKPAHYDLVLLDVRMPGMSGFELYEKLSKIDKREDRLKVYFISAYDDIKGELLTRFPNMKLNSLIRKPISIPNLIQAINVELGQS